MYLFPQSFFMSVWTHAYVFSALQHNLIPCYVLVSLAQGWSFGISSGGLLCLTPPPHLFIFQAFPFSLELQDAPDPSCIFPASALESVLSYGKSGSF